MSPSAFQTIRSGRTDIILLDVRTAEELDIARLDPCVHIPLHELQARLHELETFRHATVVCMCHHGVRSAAAAGFLRKHGFSDVHNLSGGIHAYALEVDPAIPMYG